MGFKVVYGGCKDDKKAREIVVMLRGDKLLVRKIFRKFTGSDEFKRKHPQASEIDYTRNRHILIKWAESVDHNKIDPTVVPAQTLIYEGQCYYYSKVSGQWWDLPMLQYWNKRTGDVVRYDLDREFKVSLEADQSRNRLLLILNQSVVDQDLRHRFITVYRNNEVIYKKLFNFLTFNRNRLIDGITSFSQVYPTIPLTDTDPHDIYCVVIQQDEETREFFNWRGDKLTRSIPKFLIFGLEDYEKWLDEPYQLKDKLFYGKRP